MDELYRYVTSILRIEAIKVLSTFMMLQDLERGMMQSNKQQQGS